MKSAFQLCLVLSTLLLAHVNAIVIGIDLGSEFTKVARIMPGHPPDIVLNPQSKRKTETMLSFNEGIRQFGSDAAALSSRKPHLIVSKMKEMLGRQYNTSELDLGSEYLNMELLEDEERGGWMIKIPKVNKEEDVVFTSEESAAMILQFASYMTKEHVGSKNMIKDCTIAVPSFYTQSERQAVLDAAAIADLNVLGLVEDNTAAALQFSIDRVYENKTHNVLFYNMGAESTQVSIASYTSDVIKEGLSKKNKTVGVFTMVGKGWDRNLGGKVLSLALAENMADQFNTKWGKGDVREFPRPMAKIVKEANKVKSVLSANVEIPSFIGGLHNDIDFKGHLTRAQLEDVSEDFFSRVTNPIDDALASAGFELADVHQVEILGGGVRVPKVKGILGTYFGEEMELGVHLNGDEAVAMGAVFHAANESISFKMRHIGMTDLSPFQVDVRIENLSIDGAEVESDDDATAEQDADDEGEKGPWSKQATIFKAMNTKFGSRKQVAFHHTKDIISTLRYAGEKAEELQSSMIAVYNVTGVAAFYDEMQEAIAEAEAGTRNFTSLLPKVSLSYSMDHNGIVGLVRADVSFEEILPPEISAEEDAVWRADREADDAAKAAAEEEAAAAEGEETDEEEGKDAEEGKEAEEGKDDEESSSEGDAEDGEKEKKETKTARRVRRRKEKDAKRAAEKKEELRREKEEKERAEKLKPKKVSHKKNLDFAVDRDLVRAETVLSLTIKERVASRMRLIDLQSEDDERRMTEAAKNNLETYCYSVKEVIDVDKEEVMLVSSEEQRQEIFEMVEFIEDWLYEDGELETAAVFREKQSEISMKVEAISFRATEYNLRSIFLSEAQKTLKNATTQVEDWAFNKPYITDEERESVLEKQAEVEKWLDEKVQEQEETSLHEAPVLVSKDIGKKLNSLKLMVDRLARKPKPVPKKEEKEDGDVDGEDGDVDGKDGDVDGEDGDGEDSAEGSEGNDDADETEENGEEESGASETESDTENESHNEL